MKRILSVLLVLLLAFPALPLVSSGESSSHKHVYDSEGEVAYYPTCTQPGYKHEFCIYCDYSYGHEMKPLGHYFPNPWTTVKEPTCTETGTEYNVCQRPNRRWTGGICGYEWYRDIPALGHDFGEWYVEKQPTVSEEGVERRDCSRCDAHETRPIDKLSGADKPAMFLELTVQEENAPAVPGTVLHYNFTVTNTGDTMLNLYSYSCTINGLAVSLPDIKGNGLIKPSQWITGSFTVTVTEEMCEHGSVNTEFTSYCAIKTEDGASTDDSVSADANITTVLLDEPFESNPAMNLELIVQEATAPAIPGTVLHYNFIVTNTGDTTLNLYSYSCFINGLAVSLPDIKGNGLIKPSQWLTGSFTIRVTEDMCEHGSVDVDYTSYCAINASDGSSTGDSVSADDSVTTKLLGKPLPMALSLEAHFSNLSENAYAADDTAEICYTVTNTGTEPLPVVSVCLDSETFPNGVFAPWSFENPADLAPGESYTGYFLVDLLACKNWDALGNTLAMTVHASAPVDGEDPQGNAVQADDVFLSAPVRTEEYAIKIIYAYADKAEYYPNETVTYTYGVRNIGSRTLYNVIGGLNTDDSGESIPVPFDLFGTLEPGETAEATVSRDLNELDYLLPDQYTLDIVAQGDIQSESSGGFVSDFIDVTVGLLEPEETGDMELWIEKTEVSTPANEEYEPFYSPGEDIVFQIEVWNCVNYPLYDVKVYDDYDGTLLMSFDTLEPHAYASAEYRHTVTYDEVGLEFIWDQENGLYKPTAWFENSAHAVWNNGETDPETEEVSESILYSNTVNCPMSLLNCAVLISKQETSVPKNGIFYTPGEKIDYKITVTENFGKNCNDLSVYDYLYYYDQLVCLLEDSVLGPHETLEFDYSLEVIDDFFSDDLYDGYLYNAGLAVYFSGSSHEDEDDYVEIPSNVVASRIGIENPENAIRLTKDVLSVPYNHEYYAVGETIRYSITAANISEHTVYDLEISDPIKGNDEDSVIDLGITLEPHKTLHYVYTHTVTEEDAALGLVLNYATAWYYDSASDSYVTVFSNDVTVPTESDIPAAEDFPRVLKYLLNVPANGAYFVPGETIRFGFVVDNDTDKDYENAQLYEGDLLTGKDYTLCESLEVPAHSITGEYLYERTVTEEDVDRWNSLTDYASFIGDIVGSDGDFDWVFSDPVYVPIGRDVSIPGQKPVVSKKVINEPSNGQWFTEGETIYYAVTVSNSTDSDLEDIALYDYMFNASVSRDQTLDSGRDYAPHTVWPYVYAYTVTPEDVECGDISNIAVLYYDLPGGGSCSESSEAMTVYTGPGVPKEKGPVPYMYKFVSNTPENGKFFVEGEEIEFTLCVVNTTDEDADSLTIYDILSDSIDYSVPSPNTIGVGQVATATMKYTVTAFDTDFGDTVVNMAWAEVGNEIGIFLIYSNEADAPVGKSSSGGVPSFGAFCSHELTTHGEGIATYATRYCAAHAGVERAAEKLFETADSDEKMVSAYELGAKLWMNALMSEYTKLSDSADEALASALKADCAAFTSWYERYSLMLSSGSEDKLTAARLKYEAVRRQCCELCCTAGTAPAVPAASIYSGAPQSKYVVTGKCIARVEGNAYQYTEAYIACPRALPVWQKLTSQLDSAANETEAARAWQNAVSYGLALLSQLSGEMSAGADNAAKVNFLTELNGYKQMLSTKRALYEIYYPDSPDTVNKLLSNCVLNEVCIRCAAD